MEVRLVWVWKRGGDEQNQCEWKRGVCAKTVCTCLSDPEPTAISSSARRFSSSAIYRDTTRQHMVVKQIPQDTQTNIHAHTLLWFVSLIYHQRTFLSWAWKQKNTTGSFAHLSSALIPDTRLRFPFHFTLADSLNFSCSGLLCSSYRTTPSGPFAEAVGLLSPAELPRLPLATSSWVSRRLGEGRERRHKRCWILLLAPCAAVPTASLLLQLFSSFVINGKVEVRLQI